jgi:hypothetical protein
VIALALGNGNDAVVVAHTVCDSHFGVDHANAIVPESRRDHEHGIDDVHGQVHDNVYVP